MAKLTDKQQAFINEYLKCWNASEAARRAGYSERSARIIGHENLTKPDIAAEIAQRIEEQTMSADEALLRLSKHARGTFADMIRIAGGLPLIDWEKAVENGSIDTVKEVTFHADSITVKLHDAQSALVHILKQQQLNTGVATERIEHNHRVTLNDLSDDELDRLLRRETD